MSDNGSCRRAVVSVVNAAAIAALVFLCSRELSAERQRPADGQPLRAAAVKVDITPATSKWLSGYQARQSDGVLDNIYHRVLALDAGSEQLYVISSELCLFSPGLYDRMSAELRQATGIEPRQVLWSVTHTHAAPEIGPPDIYKTLLGRSDHEWDREYTDTTVRSLIDAVRTARSRLEPARIAFGNGVALANINRRARDVDGRISLGLNPEGPVDRQFGLIRVTRQDGSPLALVVSYAMHGTVMSGQNLKISGDGPGTVASYVEERLGGTVLYVNGAAGNVAPIYSVYPNAQAGHLSQFRVLLGDRILAAVGNMAAGTPSATLALAERVLETPRRPGLEWPDTLAAYANSADPPTVRIPLRFVRINDAFIWSAPVELFSEIAIDLRERSPFAHTFYFGYTNGWLGYLPTARAFDEGGYEPRTSPFTAQAERELTDTVITVMHGWRR